MSLKVSLVGMKDLALANPEHDLFIRSFLRRASEEIEKLNKVQIGAELTDQGFSSGYAGHPFMAAMVLVMLAQAHRATLNAAMAEMNYTGKERELAYEILGRLGKGMYALVTEGKDDGTDVHP